MGIERPDPDALLAKVEREEARFGRGKLKIFFGASAGVGKTYAMLQTARERKSEGLDVVVGLVETHGRQETAALLEGLELLPTKIVELRGTALREFDLDGALKRRPALLLVDELAHSNAPGCRHPKRWQDVEELLKAGIDVYTTLNVQHLESLNDDLGEITGIRVWETVPDTVFEQADDVELVDLPPDELLVRLREGKVYLPQQARHAVENFFRKGNLIALRELALRQTADRVDAQMQDYRDDHAIREVWQAGERVLVCIGANAISERLVRAGKRLAVSLHADWIVVYVETPQLQRLPPEQRDAILKVLRLAEQLGAETVTLSGPSMSAQILDFARRRNITKIVMGKPSRRGWRRWLLGSVADTIIAAAHNINVYLLGSPKGERPGETLPAAPRLFPPEGRSARARWTGYFWSVAVTGLCSVIAWQMSSRFDLSNLVMVYLLGVIYVAAQYGRRPSIMASLLSVAAFDYFFVPPYFTFRVADLQYVFTFAAMLLVAAVVSHLTADMRSQAKVSAHRERRANALYALSQELSASRSAEEIVEIAARQVQAEFGGSNVLLFPDSEGRIVYPQDEPLPVSLRGCDLSVAQWVFDHGQIAGRGTDTLPGSAAVYFPLVGFRGPLGVLVLNPANLRRVYLPEQRRLLDTYLSQIAQAIERAHFAEEAQAAKLNMESESLRSTLLGAISHDLRTPLAAIVGAASTLADEDARLDPKDRRELSRAIYDEAQRMSALAGNILDMARFEAGQVKLNRQWYPLEEVVGGALTRLGTRLEDRRVNVSLPQGMTLVRLDAVLIEQVLINLMDNALKYTPAGTPVDIAAELSSYTLQITVADRGPGIPKGEENKLFEKFYRLGRESAQSGLGLGLAICRAIVEAHGGVIRASNRGSGGAVFSILLPMTEAPPRFVAAEAEAFADGGS